MSSIAAGLQVVGVITLLVVAVFLVVTLRRESPETERYTIHVWDENRWIEAEFEMLHTSTYKAWVDARRMVPDGTPVMVERKENN